MTVHQLADRVGSTRQGVSVHVNGAQLPTLRTMLRYARVLGVSIGWLVGEDEIQAPTAPASGAGSREHAPT
jgi:transcriptional regulator with XRE-family HTH domain